LLLEAVHHVGASGNIDKARSLGIHKEQLRALGKKSYDLRQWEVALQYYQATSQITPRDADTEAHVALCLGRLARWREADEYFARAERLAKGPWIYQSYGAIKANAGLLSEAEELLGHALEINDRDSATLASLAMLRLAQWREYEAEKLFQEALEANPNNSFAVFNYAKFLADRSRPEEARPYAELAAELDPRNRAVRDLLKKVATERREL
jgi:tetratricopeptide (TPR) repeat protein